jgi:hypothetical protein
MHPLVLDQIMEITVEPADGHELDRLITALLNATGVVRRVVDTVEHPPDADGVAVIGVVTERLRGKRALLAEHCGDEELVLGTQVLAETTLLVANHLGLGDYFTGE